MTRDGELRRALAAIEAGAEPGDLESETLEFKQQDARSVQDSVRVVVEATLCLANASGGVVVIGLADKASGKEAFKGTSLDLEKLRRAIYDSSRPALVVDIEEDQSHGVRLLHVYVPESFDIHSDTQGRAPRRVGRDCLPMDPAQQARLREERLGIDWSAQLTRRRVEGVSAGAVRAAREHLKSMVGERRKLATASDEDLLRALGVLHDGRLNRAGEILFCEHGERAKPLVTYQYRGTPGGEPRAVERLNAPLLLAFARTLELVQARRNIAPVTLPSGQQLQVEDFPELAVREALANAVIHRDYHLTESVQVEHSPQSFRISSPGPLVAGVTPKNILTHPSKPRNPALASATRILGLAEEVGRGVDRMYREMIRSGRGLPRFDASAEAVTVVLVGGAPNTTIAKFLAQLPADERDDTDTLIVLFRLCSVQNVRAEDVAIHLQKSVEEAEAVLRRLATDSVALVETTRETARRAHPTYRLRDHVIQVIGTAIPYRRRTLDDIDRKIIAHLREYETITNRTVQNLLEVNVARARTILADMVRRRLLSKVSQHERGPGVEYGRGATFPHEPERRRKK